MNDLKTTLEQDETLNKHLFSYIRKKSDPYHAERRQQQRAISNQMIKLALEYGVKKWIKGALTYTIYDRSLINTNYKKFINDLRGLRVVCYFKELNPSYLWWKTYLSKSSYTYLFGFLLSKELTTHTQVKTVYWVEEVIKNKPKIKKAA